MSETPTTIELPAQDAPAPVVFFKRSAKGKSTFRKRVATPPPASDSDDSDGYSSSDSTGAARPRAIKKRKRMVGGTVVASSGVAADAEPDVGAAKYEAQSRDMVTNTRADATKESNWYDNDADALLGRSKARAAPDADADDPTAGGSYKGAAAYGNFIKKHADAADRKPVGPVKAPTNVRTITITDYAPDVCKDYKQTGFCGFGDTCKFLHAREDYAAGWKLDREWEIKQKGGKMPVLQGKRMGTGWKAEAEEEEEMVPFKCVICKGDYKDPIQTKCGHYFCEKCAVDRYRKKNPSCAICGKRTDGVFNGAKGLKRKLDLAHEREEERKKEEEEAAAEKESR